MQRASLPRPFSLLLFSIGVAACLTAFPGSTQDRVPPAPAAKLLADATPAPTTPPTSERERVMGPSQGAVHARGAAAPRTAAPGAAGMLVGVDPETGRLGMPTPDQRLRLSEKERAAVDHSGEGLVEEHRPDGTVLIDLQGRFQEFATVRVGRDGKKTYECVEGEDAAERAVHEGRAAEPKRPPLEAK